MKIVAHCPTCDAALPVVADEGSASIKCGGCGHELGLAFTKALREDTQVDVCPVCRGSEFYLRKDFNPQVGLTVVVVGALISAGFYWFGRDLIAYSILAFAALVDLVVYGRLGDVTVCYRCHTEFRGKYTRTAPYFDLHTADVLEQEYERKIGRR
jgi:hypothetical protein